MREALKLLTLNLWNVNEPLQIRMDNLAAYLEDARPTFLAFQEVAKVGLAPQIVDIVGNLGYQWNYLETESAMTPGRDGLAVCTLGVIIDSRSLRLPISDGDDRKQIQVVTVDYAGEQLTIFNVHLTFGDRNQSVRRAQVQILLNDVLRTSGPFLICGDFNETPTSPGVIDLLSAAQLRLVDAWAYCNDRSHNSPGYTFDPQNRFLDPDIVEPSRYDYVFASTHIMVRSCDVVLDEKGYSIPVSDHYGLLASFSVV